MPPSVNDSPPERERAKQIQRAFARGQASLGRGDKPEAIRWLERAHRLAPSDGTITLLLASAALGYDNGKAAAWFTDVLDAADVRDAWHGLATARLLLGDVAGACAAVAKVLSQHAVWPAIFPLADQLARASGSPGWCALTSEGAVVTYPFGPRLISLRMDGKPIPIGVPSGASFSTALPGNWRRARSVTVVDGETAGVEHHFFGSPISLGAIGRVEGFVEAFRGGLRGWAWHPADPDSDPALTIETTDTRRSIVATDTVRPIRGLIPLARPRSFTIAWSELPNSDATWHVQGRDGSDLAGSPLTGRRASWRGRPPSLPAQSAMRGPTRLRSDLACWRAEGGDAAILITHDDGGGVERRIQTAVAAHEALHRRVIVIRPIKATDGQPNAIASCGTGHAALPSLRFELPREQRALLRLLRGMRPVLVELHHFLNHDPSIFEIIRAIGVPYDVHTHDYAWFCPRIALVGPADRYCGEPNPDACEACVAIAGSYLHEDIRIPALLDRSRAVLSDARRIIAPSRDTAERIARHFHGITPEVIPHEDDAALAEPPPVPHVQGSVLVCVAGAIGLQKGFQILLACARDARKRSLDLSFVVAGTTIDDQRLIDTGRVFVTGPYQPEEAVPLIRAQGAALGLLPSIWPETWCLGLTELWRAGLRVAAFDIGAPAERIRRTGRGFLLPLGLSAAAINNALLNATKGRSFLPIRRSSGYKPSRRCNHE